MMPAASFSAALTERGLIIYGTGFVAETLWKILDARALNKSVIGCAITRGSRSVWHGLPVRPWNEWLEAMRDLPPEERPAVCVAVHEAVYPEIWRLLGATWPGRAVWVYPELFELAFGPVLRTDKVLLSELIRRQNAENHWITVRYGLLTGWYARCGTEQQELFEGIYLKTQSLFSSERTARLRMDRFREIARDVKANGLDLDSEPGRAILIDEDLRIIDGLHRTALAVFFEARTVPCRIVAADEIYNRLFDGLNRVTPDVQDKAGLTAAERSALRDARRSLCETAAQKGKDL